MNTYLKIGLLALACFSMTARADPAAPLMTRDLMGIPGKEAIVLTVEVGPGQASPPHRHDANVLVYMLQGSLITQVKGGPEVTLHPGDTYYENPTDIHTVARNASQTEPARFLVFMVKDKGAPVTKPVAAEVDSGQHRAETAGQSLIGSPAPRMVLKTIDGESIDLGKLYGKKAVYLKFWATWCVPCREQMPHFEKTFESRGSDLEVIAVNAGFNDSVADVREYRKRLGIRMPIVIDDGTLGAALNLRVTPQHVVIGKDGRVQYVGHLANEQLEAALVAARGPVAGRAASAGSQRSAGDPALIGNAGGNVPSASDAGQAGRMGSLAAGVIPSRVAGSGREGDRAPGFSAVGLDGAQVATQGPMVLVFLSPWCESYLETSRAAVSARCRDVRLQVEDLAKQHPETRWLGVASGLWSSSDDLRKYATKYNVNIPLTLDESGTLFNSFHVRNVPTVIAINAMGVIERRIEGSDAGLATELSRVASAH